MRSDKGLDSEFRDSKAWQKDPVTGATDGDVDRYKLPTGEKAKLSLSGSERDSAFTLTNKGHYKNTSGISGVDSASDSRCISLLDFDNDGFQDLLITSGNAPTLRILRNNSSKTHDAGFIVIRVVGGNQDSTTNTKYGNRDGIGAIVSVAANGIIQTREFRSSVGMAAQNSPGMVRIRQGGS